MQSQRFIIESDRKHRPAKSLLHTAREDQSVTEAALQGRHTCSNMDVSLAGTLLSPTSLNDSRGQPWTEHDFLNLLSRFFPFSVCDAAAPAGGTEQT